MAENVNQPLPAGRLQSDAEIPTEFGKKPWRGILGFIGGSALLAGAVAFGAAWSGGAPKIIRGLDRLPFSLGVFGLGLLISSFRIKGARILQEGIKTWSYWFWFIGNSRVIPAEELGAFTLGERGGKFTVTVSYGDDCLPQKWAALKDAQAVISLGTTLYGVSAAVAITDPGMLAEAALFAAARRWTVMPEKKSRAAGERLRFADADGNAMGEIRVVSAFFGSTRAEIADGPGDFEDSGARWVLTKSFFGNIHRNPTNVMDGNLAASNISKSRWNFYWTDCDGTVWSSKFTSASPAGRSPFTLKLFCGLAKDVGSKAEQERISAMQGPAHAVAIVDGPAACFHVDVADDNAWPWVRLALAAIWLHHRPQFNYKK